MKNNEFNISLTLLFSKKWQNLSISAKSLYFHLLFVSKKQNSNDWLYFSTKNIVSSINISRASYFRAKKELILNKLLLMRKNKFIKIIEPREKKSDLQRLYNSCNA